MKMYDIVVAGGGFSGVAAAVAAARRGMRVLLAEQTNALGGAASINLVNPFMAYWTHKDGKRDYMSAGIFREILDGLRDGEALADNGMTFSEEYLKLFLNRFCLQNGVELLFNTVVTGVQKDGNTVTAVCLHNKSGNFTMRATCFVDATGDADLAAYAGVPFECGREEDGFCQPMTLCFRVGNVNDIYERPKRAEITKVYDRWKAAGKIHNPREDVLTFGTLCQSVWHFNTTRVVKRSPLDGFDITAAEIEAREQAWEIFTMLKTDVPGFENAVLLSTALQIGVRESRRIKGLHTLTAEELKNCTVFPDSIAVGNYDIDIHNPAGSGTSHYYFKDGDYYTVPYRSLVPMSGAENLLVTGRCISATHEAQASIRIMPFCCCFGEAAGEAAALVVQSDCKAAEVDVPTLQARLIENGARIW